MKAFSISYQYQYHICHFVAYSDYKPFSLMQVEWANCLELQSSYTGIIHTVNDGVEQDNMK